MITTKNMVDKKETTDKSAIAQAFGRAASDYDQHAAFQRDVGHRLLNQMPDDLNGYRVVDLGCGTGYFSKQLQQRGAEVICIDISVAMLQQAHKRCGAVNMHYVLADAEHLPLLDNSVDFVFSSLALQWCHDLNVPLTEVTRILKSNPDANAKQNGQLFFTTLVDGSLTELRQAWQTIDTSQHVNQFISSQQLNYAVQPLAIHSSQLDIQEIIVPYSSAVALMRDLKGIGATYVKGRQSGLISARTIAQVERAYQQFKQPQGFLPATYQVCFGVIQL